MEAYLNLKASNLSVLIMLLFSVNFILGQEKEVNRGSVTLGQNSSIKEFPFKNKSYALLIGNINYEFNEWDKLPGVEEDLEQITEVLELHGFKVIQYKDLKSIEFTQKIQDFIFDYAQDPLSRVLIYYAGHGHTLEEFGGYLVPTDAPKPHSRGGRKNEDLSIRNEFRRRAIKFSDFKNYSSEILSKHQLFVFDACFAGSVLSRGDEEDLPHDVSIALGNPAKQIITSGTADQSVPDVSSFRKYFVKALTTNSADKDKNGYISYNELFGYLRREVTNEVKALYERDQTPQRGSFLRSDLETGEYTFKVPMGSENRRIGKYKLIESILKTGSDRGVMTINNEVLEGDLYIDGEFQNKVFKNKRYVYSDVPVGSHEIKIVSPTEVKSFSYEVNSSNLALNLRNEINLKLIQKNPLDSIAYQILVDSLRNSKDTLRIRSFKTEWGPVEITFGITNGDGKSADQPVNPLLFRGLVEITNDANRFLIASGNPRISALHLPATTNGKHATSSNHYRGLALDIGRINGQRIIQNAGFAPNAFGAELEEEVSVLMGLDSSKRRTYLQTLALQVAIQKFPNRRENFGPFVQLKYLKEKGVSEDRKTLNFSRPHSSHIHFSVR